MTWEKAWRVCGPYLELGCRIGHLYATFEIWGQESNLQSVVGHACCYAGNSVWRFAAHARLQQGVVCHQAGLQSLLNKAVEPGIANHLLSETPHQMPTKHSGNLPQLELLYMCSRDCRFHGFLCSTLTSHLNNCAGHTLGECPPKMAGKSDAKPHLFACHVIYIALVNA